MSMTRLVMASSAKDRGKSTRQGTLLALILKIKIIGKSSVQNVESII